MRAGEGRVTAQIDLGHRREPSCRRLLVDEKRGFRQVSAATACIHPASVGSSNRDIAGCRVTGKPGRSKVNDVQRRVISSLGWRLPTSPPATIGCRIAFAAFGYCFTHHPPLSSAPSPPGKGSASGRVTAYAHDAAGWTNRQANYLRGLFIAQGRQDRTCASTAAAPRPETHQGG